MALRVIFVKIGFLGTTPLLEALMDERGVRNDITIRSVSTGCRMQGMDGVEAAEKALTFEPELIVLVGPNLSSPGLSAALEVLLRAGKPILAVTDVSSKKFLPALEEKGVGYIVVEADSMIAARRDFLDPVEMALFNSDVIRVLGVTGVYRLLHLEIDRIVEELKAGKGARLPRLIIDKEKALAHGEFHNPYAGAKAMASFEMARRVGEFSTQACYVVKERKRYMPLAAAAHELMRAAAILSDVARECEKKGDTVSRRVHIDDGSIHGKKALSDAVV